MRRCSAMPCQPRVASARAASMAPDFSQEQSSRPFHSTQDASGSIAVEREASSAPLPPAGSVGDAIQRLAARILDLGVPRLLDAADDRVGHRNVVERLSHLVALLIGPGEEL